MLGRNVTARIANLREVKWESLALNFVLVFSPNTLVGAPHNLLATITLPKDAPLAAEAKLAQQIGRAFPATTAIRVKDAIDAFSAIFNRVMVAVRAAGSVTLLAGALVLAGALATAQRRRIQQAVILKTLGATSRRILLSHLAEYAVLALLTSFIALLIGSLAAWITVSRVMDVDFTFSIRAAAEAMLASDGAGGAVRRLRHLAGSQGAARCLICGRSRSWLSLCEPLQMLPTDPKSLGAIGSRRVLATGRAAIAIIRVCEPNGSTKVEGMDQMAQIDNRYAQAGLRRAHRCRRG